MGMPRQVALLAAFLLLLCRAALGAGVIVVAGSDWPVWETARAMDALGRTPQAAYQFYEFRNYQNSIAQFQAGQADALFVNLYDYLALCRSRDFAEQTAVVLVTDYSKGGDMIVARPGIDSVRELRGRAVGLDVGSLSLYLLHLALAAEGVSLQDVTLMDVPAELIGVTFEKEPSLAAVVGWNPYAAQALRAGGRKLSDSSRFPGRIVDVLAVWRDSLDRHRPEFQAYLKAWFQALNDPAVLAKMAELNKVGQEEFSSWLAQAQVVQTPAAALKAAESLGPVIREVDRFMADNARNVLGPIEGTPSTGLPQSPAARTGWWREQFAFRFCGGRARGPVAGGRTRQVARS